MSATTVADGSGNYSFTVTGTGSYTVTPSKTGIGFQPGSQTVNLNRWSNGVLNFTATPMLQSIAISAAAASIAKESGDQFTAIGTFSDGTTQNLTSSVTWASSNTAVATVGATGLATGIGAGSASITAAEGGITSNAIALAVVGPTLHSITISAPAVSIAKGSGDQFTATGTFSDSTTRNLTSSVTWTSSNTAVATVGANGMATGAGVGSASITASQGTIASNAIALTVTSPSLLSITVTAQNASLSVGASEKFTANGTFSDGTTQDLTSSATWSSSNPAAATISTIGLVAGVAAGQTTISAMQAGVTGSFALSVTGGLTITTTSVPNGQVGQAYSTTLSASGGTGAQTWSLSTGQLPAGLNLSGGGVISGTPSTQGNSVFGVQVKDSSTPAQTATATLAISVLTPLSLTVSNASFPAGVVVGDVSAAPQAITVTNNSGSSVTFVVDHIETGFSNGAGYGGMMETGSVLVQRNYGNTCQPYVSATATLKAGASCQFNLYLFPTAAGAVSGTAKVEYVPTPTNPLISISIGSGVRNVITQNPVANLQVGNYVTIIGTPDDPCCNLGTQITNYNDTRRILSVTDSTHFTIDNSTSPQLSPVNNQGLISDAYPAFDTFVSTANVSGTGIAPPAFDAAHPPTLPLGIASDYSGTVMDTHYSAPAACTGSVISDAPTLTSRLANASCGEVLCLQAGTPIQGLFTLKNIAGCSQYTDLISSDYTNSAFPQAGTRVQPSDEPHLGILQGNNIGPTLQADVGASYWRVVGVELTRTIGVSGSIYGPLYMAKYGFPATSAATVNHHIICDRCYIHRQDADTNGMTVGAEMDGNNLAVIDSYIANIGQGSSDDTAVGNCNGNGPIKVVNTYLEATGMATIFGGCDPPWIGSYPQDIEFRNNVYTKRLGWQTSALHYVKNLLEFKNGERVLVTGSLFQDNWADEQNGTAIVFEPANQHGAGVSNRVRDVTFDYNVLAHSTHAIGMVATGYLYPTAQTRRVLIQNMLFQDIGGINSPWVTGGWGCPSSFNCGWLVGSMSSGGAGAKYGPTIPLADIGVNHVTSFTPAGVYDMSGAQQGIQNVFTTNNMLLEGNGVAGDSQAPGSSAIGYYMLNPAFKTNAMIGTPTDASNYPSVDPSGSGITAFYWEGLNTLGTNTNLFRDWSNCNSGSYSISACALNAVSYYLPGGIRQASDGKQAGADITGLQNRTACVKTGAACNPLP